MARPTVRPVPPRVSPPDLPEALNDAAGRRNGDHVLQRIPLADDLAHARFEQCSLSGSADRADLTGVTLLDVEIVDVRAAVVTLKDATVRRLRISGGRIGTLDLSGAHVAELILEHARIDYLTLAAAKIQDSLIADCTLTTLDLPAATATRVRFERTRVDEVDTRGLRADSLDLRGLDAEAFLDVSALRGATLTPHQVALLAPVFARAAGIDVQD
ncbi:pentapeptide repeat-containing protein [Microbacterium capsulatum]|uniref:Pentapeptide repeat-containing protein n=1 Tax=Microbacterium capsulatum TaxID=3041921 RepID=A0ABU0XD64_9MICO|nr:pentapeptide repeat-containing protein [Microbacterium sp. ASV81]MDQ4213047.1 pentapeptide repeat-containing protein [Microbacterium sp. ASV81]